MTLHLAEMNIAGFRTPVNDPVNADFVNALDDVNAMPQAQLGFVWRPTGQSDKFTWHELLRAPCTDVRVWPSLRLHETL
jgi:hypothetical protein